MVYLIALQEWNYTIMTQTHTIITKVMNSFFEMILKKKYWINLNINNHKKIRRFNNLKYLIK